MASVSFAIKDDDLQTLLEKINSFQEKAELKINDYLKTGGAPKAIKSIEGIIPVSNRNKEHAKNSLPLESQNVNLGFIIKSKVKFNYLYFPDQAQGTSRKKDAKEFMQTGIDNVYDVIVAGIINAVDNTWKE